MNTNDLSEKFSRTAEDQEKAIFANLFIICNRLQTLFDARIPQLSLKQFMLLAVARHSEESLTFTQLGELLGCSRQNVRKLAEALARKGFVRIEPSPEDARALCLCLTEKTDEYYANDFPKYQRELRYLFDVYTPEETATLFRLLTKLYKGIDILKAKAETDEKEEEE